MQKIFKYEPVKVKEKHKNMDLAMYIMKLNKFDIVKKEFKEFGQQSKNLNSKNMRL